MTVKIGDKVWFISKFGDRVEGEYIAEKALPFIEPPKYMSVVRSHNAFGEYTEDTVDCLVPKNKLHPV